MNPRRGTPGEGAPDPDPGCSPPRRWERILSRVLPKEDREALRHELAALYAAVARRQGEERARRRYRREVLAFAVRAPGRGVRQVWRTIREVGEGGLREGVRTARGLARAPGFTLAAVLTLALGMAAASVIFAVADRALVRPLPYPEAHRVVSVLDGWGSSLGGLDVLQRRMTSLELVGGAWDATGMTLEDPEGGARRISAALVSPEYLQALRPTLAAGRLFRPGEAQPGRGQVAILSWDLWQRAFGRDPRVLETSLTLEGREYRVVGVLPRGFDLPSSRNDLWLPVVMDPSDAGLFWGVGTYTLVGRLAPGATPDQVREELQRVGEEVRLANPLWTPPPDFWKEARVAPLQEARSRWARTPVLILLGSVGVVLLVVCANVSNLLLSRSLARGREGAVRASLGASSGRLAGAHMAEALLLAAGGTGLGLAGAFGGLEALRPLLPPELPGVQGVSVDLRVVGFTAVVGLVTALVSGVAPALRSARRGPAALLREGGRSRGGGRSRRRVIRVLVGTQVAAAVLLVTGAVLLVRSLEALNGVDPGFEIHGRVTARLDLPAGLDDDRDTRALYLERLRESLEADGALAGVALASTIPFGREAETMATLVPGVTPDPNNLPVVNHRRVTPGFFQVMGIPVLDGRAFTSGDRMGSPLVALVDGSFVREFFGEEDPVGRVVRYPWRGAPDLRIVGVVGDTRASDLSGPAEPTVWVPMAQMGLGPPDHAVVVARASGGPAGALAAVQAGARGFDPGVAVSEMVAYPDLLRDSLAANRLLTVLLLGFAGTTVLLGCIGIYGVVAFTVREELGEIGVRMALGADPARIRRRVLRDGLRLALPGALVGMAGAAAGSRVLDSLLFGVTPWDPLAFGVAPLLMLGVSVLAVHLPARRATRVDPVQVLREG